MVFTTAVVGALLFWMIIGLDALAAWLVAINLVTFSTFGYDKLIAGSNATRVPETVLLISTLFGGSIGALAGMFIFRHKTSKTSFKTRVFLVILVQAGFIVLYYLPQR